MYTAIRQILIGFIAMTAAYTEVKIDQTVVEDDYIEGQLTVGEENDKFDYTSLRYLTLIYRTDLDLYISVHSNLDEKKHGVGLEITKESLTIWCDKSGMDLGGKDGIKIQKLPKDKQWIVAGWSQDESTFYLAYDMRIVAVLHFTDGKAFIKIPSNVSEKAPWSKDAYQYFRKRR